MPRISQLVEIKTGYANYVNLVDEFTHPDRNRARMEGYMPIGAHRASLERLAHLCLPMDDRVYLLLGTYGTGKSHLLLMLANYLSRAPHEPESTLLHDSWARQDPDQAAKVKNWRGDGRYLVGLTDFGKGGGFESMVLRAIEAACEREGYEGFLDTHYGEAVRRLKGWQQQEAEGGPSGAYRDFVTILEQHYPAVTLDKLIQALDNYDLEALDQFKDAYRAALGTDFSPRADNLVDILQSFVGARAFSDRYRGLVILADEFGYCLDRGSLRTDVFHRFTELCRSGIGGATLAFIGTGHRVSLQAYAGSGYSEADIGVLADRIEAVPLRSEGIEQIIAAVVVPKKEDPLWQEHILPQTSALNKLAMGCATAGIFRELSGSARRQQIIEDIYPLHPMATHCAIELATAVGSAARSLFTFFAGKPNVLEAGSYPWYVANTEIATDGALNLYTADRLVTYFEDELQPENLQTRKPIADEVRNYQASLRLAEEQASAESLLEVDPLIHRVLHLILVYRIVGIASTRENVLFGLHTPTIFEQSRVKNLLAQLARRQILFLNPTTKTYEFRIAGAGRDIKQYIDSYLADASLHPTDVAQALIDTEKLRANDLWLSAAAHNGDYAEDKRLLRVFALPGELEAKEYISGLDGRLRQETDWRRRHEGVAVYVLCESRSDVERARRVAAQNTSHHVILGIAEEPIPIREALLNLLGALYVREHENLDDWSEQERLRLSRDYIGDRTKGYTGAFVRQRDRYLRGKELCWFGQKGHILVSHPTTPHEPASVLMGQLYPERSISEHLDLNQIHVRFGAKTNVSLIDAVNALVRTGSPLTIDTSLSVSSGAIRYLRSALANHDVLSQVGKAVGSQVTYRVRSDTTGYAKTYPALANLMQTLVGMDPGASVTVRRLVTQYAGPPYGQGPYALSLFLAVAIRALGDNLQLKWSPEDWGAVTISSADQVFDLVNGRRPNAVFVYRQITDHERDFINHVFRLFSEDPGPAGQDHSVSEAHGALWHWWARQTNLSKVSTIYASSQTAPTERFVQKMAQMESYTPHTFVLGELQTAYGMDREDAVNAAKLPMLVEELEATKQATQQEPGRLKRELLQRLVAFFNPTSHVYGAYTDAIETWYNSLEPYQQDAYAFPATQQQAPALLQHLPTISNVEDTFWVELPRSAGFGLGAVDDWTFDRSEDYVTKFDQALKAIAELRPPVPDPIWKAEGKEVRINKNVPVSIVEYRENVRFRVSLSRKVSQVFLTSNGDDPRKTDSQRLEISGNWEETISRSSHIKMASRAADGTYGRVVQIHFRDQDDKYKVQYERKDIFGDRWYRFALANNSTSLGRTLDSLLLAALKEGKMSREQLGQLLRPLADEYGN